MLRALLAGRACTGRDREHLEELSFELERALVLDPVDVPASVITMQTRVRVLDLNSGERREFVLVYPPMPMSARIASPCWRRSARRCSDIRKAMRSIGSCRAGSVDFESSRSSSPRSPARSRRRTYSAAAA
jgi:hypothetical protein